MRKKLKLIVLIIIIIVLSISIKTLKQNQKIQKNINQYNAKALISDEEKAANKAIGENSKISSIQITKRKTGTGPFDENDEAGNDSSENNNIVRSFDQITWTIEATMALKENSIQESYKGGIIEIQAEIPENCKDLTRWDLESMAWAEEKQISEDGRIFTAKYIMPKIEITVPGKQALVLVLKIDGAPNGLEIIPKITMNLYGNKEEEKRTIQGEKVNVSATTNYNVKLVQNTELEKKLTVDYGKGNTIGRMYGYGAILQLYNENASKGIKGIEYLKGEIKFDLELKLTRSKLGSSELEDITNKCTPILWNYKINNIGTNYGKIQDRIMYWGNSYHRYISNAPIGVKSDRIYSVYNSGNINMKQEKNIINVTIKNYDFDNIFPKCNYYYSSHPHNNIEYTENIGCFSIGYFQIFVPDNEESTIEDRNYYLTVSDTNFSATSSSGINISKQIKENDDICTVQHVIYKRGKYEHAMTVRDEKYNNPLSSSYESGDGYTIAGNRITLACKFAMDINNDRDIYGADKFVKFDGNCIEPQIFEDGDKYKIRISSYAGTMKFKVYYVTKKDGNNWTSQTDMNNGNIDEMDLYENIEDIPKNKLCIGMFFESESGYLAVSTGDNNTINIPLKVKDTASIGQTYEFTQNTKYWLEALDRTKYSQKILSGYDKYPKIEWDSGNRNYIKTEYNENGTITEGTHNGGWHYGQTLLITGAEMSITKNALGDETDVNKTNYDFSKNEYNVTYKLVPTLINSANKNANITDVTLRIEDIIPAEMEYVGGSCNYNEPEINKNLNGTTTLTWYIYGAKVGEQIEPIIYQAHIDELTENGTILNSTAVISEVPNINSEGKTVYKIGNKIVNKRTINNSIQIINLSSYSLFKTTKTPVIEINDKMNYKITCINKTDNALEDFKLLDILPYNGDNRGTSYEGIYRIEKIEIKQTNTVTSKTNGNEEINLYITENKNARNGITVKDENFEKENIWKKVSSGEILNRELTAIAIAGKLPEKTKLELEIYLKTDRNNSGDVYKNYATVQTSKETEAMQTSVISVKTVKRKIEGVVWEDSNKDGLISDGEKLISGIQLKLLKEDDLSAINIYGDEMPVVTTDENGKYAFEDMEKGKYKVKILGLDSEKEEVTQKEVGINKEINNKFNQDGTTDILGRLNNINSPILVENHINAGIIYKEINKNDEITDLPEKQEEIKEENQPEIQENNDNNIEEIEQEFNLYINKKITKITINQKNKKVKNGKLEKIEISTQKIENSEIELEYLVEVQNTGNISGKAIIEEIIPQGLEIVKAENWQIDNQNITSNLKLEPGENKELAITLKWSGGEENFGTKTNIAKIKEVSNETECEETTKEDNESKAEIIISIKTGMELKTKALIIGIIGMIMFLITLIIKKRIVKKYILIN